MRAFITFALGLATFGTPWAQHLDASLHPSWDGDTVKLAKERWEARMSDQHAANESNSTWEVTSVQRNQLGAITSIMDGLWNNPDTWDCGCIPGGGDDVVVLHAVTLQGDASVQSLNVEGILSSDVPSTLDLGGDLWVSGQAQLESTALLLNDVSGRHVMEGQATLGQVWITDGSALTLKGSLSVTDHVELDDSVLSMDGGELRLTEGAYGRATVARVRGGAVIGEVTRVIRMAAMPNSAFYLNYNIAVQQLFSTGLEGVTVADLMDDMPTMGFPGADVESGISNIYHWSESLGFTFITDSSYVLPSWEGIYIGLPLDEEYELDFTGTLPPVDYTYELTATTSGMNCLGNATGMGLDLQALLHSIPETNGSLFCWNLGELRFDQYVDGRSNNGMENYIEPNQVCQMLMMETVSTAVEGEAVVRSVDRDLVQSDDSGLAHIEVSLQNSTGFYDSAILSVQQDASFDNVAHEDAVDVYSNLNSCNIYFMHHNWRYGISQVGFEGQTMLEADIKMASLMPLDNVFTVTLREVEVGDHCAYIQWEGQEELLPLVAGMSHTVTLSSTSNHQDRLLGKVLLAPPVRAEAISSGCESGQGSSVEVTPSGLGPWTIALTNEMGEPMGGTVMADSVTTVFDNLPSGIYLGTVTTDDTLACGVHTFTREVTSGTTLTMTPAVTADCGEGGRIELNVQGGVAPLSVTWLHGQEGSSLNGLEGGTYTAIAMDAHHCADTLDVEVLSLPAFDLISQNTTCDSEGPTSIEFHSEDLESTWTLTLTQDGEVVDHVEDIVASHDFSNLGSGDFTVEVIPMQQLGCASESATFTLLEPVPMNLVSDTQVQCNDDMLGQATVEIEGGVGSIQLTWEHGAEGPHSGPLASGNHLVTAVDELGCEETFVVTIDLAPQADVHSVSPGCDGDGMTELHVEGAGDAAWNFTIYNELGELVAEFTEGMGEAHLTSLPTGAYHVVAIDASLPGCPPQETDVELVAPSDLEVTWDITPLGCDGLALGAIDLEIEGSFEPFAVVWAHGPGTPSLTGLAAGEYYATVTDHTGCQQEVRVALEDAPHVEADFSVPMGGLTDGNSGMTLTFTNTSEGATGYAWFFGDSEIPTYDVHPTYTFEEPGTYDVYLNAWNDQCSHTLRKTVTVSLGESGFLDMEVDGSTSDMGEQSGMDWVGMPWMTETGWALELGSNHQGMKLMAYDLTGRALCTPATPDANGRVWVEADQWPGLVLLRLVHESSQSIRTWKMVR